jgi:ferredoxin-NADP reductase
MTEIPGQLLVIVRQMRSEAAGVLSLTLEQPDRSDLPEWSPGAHIDIILPNGLIRPYSMCGSPADRSRWLIAVLDEPESRGGSSYIHHELRPGDLVGVLGPRNQFPLVAAAHHLLIAGGIGLTPLLTMASYLADHDADWHLLYGGRRRASMAFIETLEAYGDHVTVWPEDEFGLLDLYSVISATSTDTAIYCCGPEPLIAAVERLCVELSRPGPHVERFSSNPNHVDETDSEGDTPFDVVLSASGKRFTIPKDRTIVDVLTENRLFVPTSCTEGYCGVCETVVLEGVPDHRDDLDDETRPKNTMRVCVGRSKTAELVLKL